MFRGIFFRGSEFGDFLPLYMHVDGPLFASGTVPVKVTYFLSYLLGQVVMCNIVI